MRWRAASRRRRCRQRFDCFGRAVSRRPSLACRKKQSVRGAVTSAQRSLARASTASIARRSRPRLAVGLAHEPFQPLAKRARDRLGDVAVAAADAQRVRAFARAAADALVVLARALGEPIEQGFIVDAFERGEPEVGTGSAVTRSASSDARVTRASAVARSRDRSQFARCARSTRHRPARAAAASHSRAQALGMDAGEEIEPELARFGAHALNRYRRARRAASARDRRAVSSQRCVRPDQDLRARSRRDSTRDRHRRPRRHRRVALRPPWPASAVC